MDLKWIIISVACFACLTPSVYPIGVKEAKAVAIGAAAKGAVLLGAKALVKKGVGAIVAKGALLKGILATKGTSLLATKGAALKGAVSGNAALIRGVADLGANVIKTGAEIVADELSATPMPDDNDILAVQSPGPGLEDSVIEYTPQLLFPVSRPLPVSVVMVDVQEPDLPAADMEVITNRLSNLWSKLKQAGNFKSRLVGRLLRTMEDTPVRNTPLVYNIIRTPRIHRLPYIEVTEEIKN